MATVTTSATAGKIETYLGAKAESLLGFRSAKISKEKLHLPGPDFVDRVWAASDRNVRVLAAPTGVSASGVLAYIELEALKNGKPVVNFDRNVLNLITVDGKSVSLNMQE